MKNKKIFWQIFPTNLLILILTLLCLSWFGKLTLERFVTHEQERGLSSRAYLIRSVVTEMYLAGDMSVLREYCKNSGRLAKTRVTVIEKNGTVVADSDENPESMELHNNREEIITALEGKLGSSIRLSKTLGKKMHYLAIPMIKEDDVDKDFGNKADVLGVLRVSVPVDSIEVAVNTFSSRMLLAVLVLIVIAAGASLFVSRNISHPLVIIKGFAEKFSKGDFSQKMPLFKSSSASLEVVSLANAIDKMAEQLNERIEMIKSQRNELETVFSSMVESVIAVDRDEKVININRAAARLLGIERENAKGKIVQEVFRNLNLQQQIRQVLATGISMEDEIVHLDSGGEKLLQNNIVSLNDNKSNVLGALVVLNDVTKMRRLENVRRDFVANVSHELRTPITSIRGYVETLLDGAIDDRDDAIQFLDTVLRQAERLNEIIEDLLALSRIEEEAENGLIKLEKGSIRNVLDVAIETCQLKAEEAGVNIVLECDETIVVHINGTLIEQAIVNLLVNAIRYSRQGEDVRIVVNTFVDEGSEKVRIDVIDTGVGIAANHLPRLFERFYRSDKARSRKQGGTGLGLAIVKHIALAHNGAVDVQSKMGEGSTFSIILPG